VSLACSPAHPCVTFVEHHHHHIIEHDESAWAQKPGTIAPHDTGERAAVSDIAPADSNPYPNQPWITAQGATPNPDTADARAHGDLERSAVHGNPGVEHGAHGTHGAHGAHDAHTGKPNLAHRIEGEPRQNDSVAYSVLTFSFAGSLKEAIGKISGKDHLVEQGRQLKVNTKLLLVSHR
jgi:hypothetical protein